jgi:four helix bundle protein
VSSEAELVGGRVQSYRDLGVWQKSMTLSVACYGLTKDFPREEIYGMTSQLRRASVSIAANIAEGYGREHTKSFVQFLRIAQGSLKELETHLILSGQVDLVKPARVEPLLLLTDELGRMLRSLIRSLQKKAGEID